MGTPDADEEIRDFVVVMDVWDNPDPCLQVSL